MNSLKFIIVVISCIIIGFLMDYLRETYSVPVALSLVIAFILVLLLYNSFKKNQEKKRNRYRYLKVT